MTRKTVLLLFGGESSEHDVSISSARNIYAAMDGEKYETLLCYIDRNGKWWLLDSWQESFEDHGGSQLLVAPGTGSLMVIPGNTVVHPDVILPVLHGKFGEDGTVQGLAALAHIPIVGCDTTSSAVTMDKIMTKQILEANGIKSARYKVYQRGDKKLHYADVAAALGETVFVKPARAGSSVGVSKVRKASEFGPAIDLALAHDDRVLIEEALVGRELEVAVRGAPPHHQVSGVGEIIPGQDFYNYEDKYATDSTAEVLTNVDLPEGIEQVMQDTTHRVYELLACKGLARVDYILQGKTPYIVEVNSFPGFTNISMYPKLWRATGMHYPELVDALIEDALR